MRAPRRAYAGPLDKVVPQDLPKYGKMIKEECVTFGMNAMLAQQGLGSRDEQRAKGVIAFDSYVGRKMCTAADSDSMGLMKVSSFSEGHGGSGDAWMGRAGRNRQQGPITLVLHDTPTKPLAMH